MSVDQTTGREQRPPEESLPPPPPPPPHPPPAFLLPSIPLRPGLSPWQQAKHRGRFGVSITQPIFITHLGFMAL